MFNIAYLVESVVECLLATRSSTKHPPIVYDKFMSTRSRFPFRGGLQGADKLNARFQGQGKGIVCLRLVICMLIDDRECMDNYEPLAQR